MTAQREPVVEATHRTLHRERRPSGERPPLPYVIDRRSRLLLGLAVLAAVAWAIAVDVFGQDWWLPRFDAVLLDGLVDLRADWLVDVAEVINGLQAFPIPLVLSGLLLLALLLTRRIRRLLVLAGALLVTMLVTIGCQGLLELPRPYDVDILGSWAGYGGFQSGYAYLACVLVAAVLSLVPGGRGRIVAAVAVAALLVAVVLAGTLLATVYPLWGLIGVGLAAAITLLAFWMFAPDESFPVVYRRSGSSAHLDLGGARGDAIRRAIATQLGFEVLAIKPFGLSGSAGSSPMRVTVAGDPVAGNPDHAVFAKLFAQQHLRADRIYKLIRGLVYGRLEDEHRFLTVKRLAQNEDYLMRVFRDAGAPVVESYGVAELTPEREYLLVTGFAEGSREIGDAESVVDDAIIDQGLLTVREMWDAGLAHRDVKPANYLVNDGRLVMIDLGFAEVRPSPWRQAVDLANMMLILALKTDAARVYQAAMRYFTPDDVAEAFAATRGLTVPTQLQAYIKADGRDLIGEFRSLAPAHEAIEIQRWSLRRIGLTLGVVAAALVMLVAAFVVFFGYDPDSVGLPDCRTASPVLLFGQAQQDAASVPCLVAMPAAWSDATASVKEDAGHVSASTPTGKVQLAFLPACDVGTATPRPDLQLDGVAVFELPPSGDTATFAAPLPGGCVQLEVSGPAADRPEMLSASLAIVQLVPRLELDADVARRTGGWATELSG